MYLKQDINVYHFALTENDFSPNQYFQDKNLDPVV